MSTPEPRALTEACSMCPETLVAFTDTELTEQLSSTSPATTTAPPRPWQPPNAPL